MAQNQTPLGNQKSLMKALVVEQEQDQKHVSCVAQQELCFFFHECKVVFGRCVWGWLAVGALGVWRLGPGRRVSSRAFVVAWLACGCCCSCGSCAFCLCRGFLSLLGLSFPGCSLPAVPSPFLVAADFAPAAVASCARVSGCVQAGVARVPSHSSSWTQMF